MKVLWILIVIAALGVAQEQTEKTPAAPAAPKKAAPKKSVAKAPANANTPAKAVAKKNPGPITIPADAKEISPGTFRAVDSKGVAWLYYKTPFGISRGPEQGQAAVPQSVPTDWKATEEGDSIAFERPYPFGGTHRWTKKKNDLSDTEAAVWKRVLETRAASDTGGKI